MSCDPIRIDIRYGVMHKLSSACENLAVSIKNPERYAPANTVADAHSTIRNSITKNEPLVLMDRHYKTKYILQDIK